MQVIVTKGEMWDLLGNKALAFAAWLNGPSDESRAMLTMLENTAGLDLASPLISGQLLPLLVQLQVIDQAVIDRVNARIAQEGISPAMPGKRYKVYLPLDIVDAPLWLQSHATGEITYSISGFVADVEVITGLFECNSAEVNHG